MKKNIIQHIQGIRGLAVLLVLFFHSQIDTFSYGYLGVDIFFVISGYVVTLSIMRRVEVNGTLDYKYFIKQRIIRLFPVFLIVTIVSLVLSYFLQEKFQFRENALDSISSLFYFANIRFIFSLDYFSIDAIDRLFTHYWSLSVEEQFYIFFPLLYFWLVRKAYILFIIALSCIAYLILYTYDPNTAFFLTFSRVFALLSGVYIAIYERVKELYLLLASAALFSLSLGLEAVLSFVVVIFSILLIKFGYSYKIFNFKSLKYVGNLSYSLYLVHWPVVVFISLYGIDTKTLSGFFAYLSISIFISITLFNFFEKGVFVGFLKKLSFKKIIMIFLSLNLLILGVIVFLIYTPLVNNKGALREEVLDWSLNGKNKMKSTWDLVDSGYASNPKLKQVVILGDSNGKDMFNALKLNGIDNITFKRVSHACGVSLNPAINSHKSIKTKNDVDLCNKKIISIIEDIKKINIEFLMVATYWKANELDDVFDVISLIKSKVDVDVLVVGPPVFFSRPVPAILDDVISSKNFSQYLDHEEKKNITFISQKYLHKGVRNKNVMLKEKANSMGLSYLDRWNIYCESDGTCPLFDDKNERLLKGDKFHLTLYGAKYFGLKMKGKKIIEFN